MLLTVIKFLPVFMGVFALVYFVGTILYVDKYAKDEKFHKAFLTLFFKYSLTPNEITGVCGVSLPTVIFWTQGRNFPHPLMRPMIIEAIEKYVKEGKEYV